VEERLTVCVRLMPSIGQQLQEALISLAKAEAKVLAHSGWEYGQRQLTKAQEEVKRLAAQLESASK
jgi:hypothetical protein